MARCKCLKSDADDRTHVVAMTVAVGVDGDVDGDGVLPKWRVRERGGRGGEGGKIGIFLNCC